MHNYRPGHSSSLASHGLGSVSERPSTGRNQELFLEPSCLQHMELGITMWTAAYAVRDNKTLDQPHRIAGVHSAPIRAPWHTLTCSRIGSWFVTRAGSIPPAAGWVGAEEAGCVSKKVAHWCHANAGHQFQPFPPADPSVAAVAGSMSAAKAGICIRSV